MVYWVVNALVLIKVVFIVPVPVSVPAPLNTWPVAPGVNVPSTVIVPAILKLTPLVVVPALIVKLLNVAN